MNHSALANCYTLHTMHLNHENKDAAYFERKQDQVKYAELDTTGSFYKENSALVTASYYVTLQIAKQKKPHTISETLIKLCASEIVELVLGDESPKELDTILLSDNTMLDAFETWHRTFGLN